MCAPSVVLDHVTCLGVLPESDGTYSKIKLAEALGTVDSCTAVLDYLCSMDLAILQGEDVFIPTLLKVRQRSCMHLYIGGVCIIAGYF